MGAAPVSTPSTTPGKVGDEGEDGEPAPDTGGATATDTGIASAIYEDLNFPTEADSWSESYYGAASEGFLWRLVHGVAGERETEFDAITAVGIAVGPIVARSNSITSRVASPLLDINAVIVSPSLTVISNSVFLSIQQLSVRR